MIYLCVTLFIREIKLHMFVVDPPDPVNGLGTNNHNETVYSRVTNFR